MAATRTRGDLTAAERALWERRFADTPQFCGDGHAVGSYYVKKQWDWTERPTTPDQARIEAWLETTLADGESLLHVGLGNSRLAERFSARCRTIVGMSITGPEVEHAVGLNIANYLPLLENKFSTAFAETFDGAFDFIIDNNPSSFACCFFHFARMMRTYRRVLKDDGRIVTEALGLGWVAKAPQVNPRWGFSFDDWAAVTLAYGLVTEALDDGVIVSRQRLS